VPSISATMSSISRSLSWSPPPPPNFIPPLLPRANLQASNRFQRGNPSKSIALAKHHLDANSNPTVECPQYFSQIIQNAHLTPGRFDFGKVHPRLPSSTADAVGTMALYPEKGLQSEQVERIKGGDAGVFGGLEAAAGIATGYPTSREGARC
jgi:hypothetical protein